MALSKSALLALLPFFLALPSVATSGSGTTTRYWDCCKPSCSWSNKATLSSGPVLTCDKDDNPLSSPDAKSACDGGPAFMCSNESPWAVTDDLAYGYAAVHIAGGSESSWCCACYELTFTSGPVQGKKMVVQATNTGGDLGDNHFDISIPGGGFGIFNGCTPQYGTPSTGWGEQYGGISTRSQCDAFPEKLKDGCYWRYDWFKNADNPTMTFKQVNCPKALTAKSGCVRADDSPTGEADVSTKAAVVSTPVADVSTKAAVVSTPVADVSTKAAAVSTPVADVSTNAAEVSTPVADVSINAAEVSTPVADASTKAADISTKAADVSTKAAAVSTPVADASTKAAAVSTPVADASTKSVNVSTAPAVAEVSTAILPAPVATMTEWVCDGTSATVPKYGRCGGIGYTGPTVCAEGSTCTVSNEWYSQCV